VVSISLAAREVIPIVMGVSDTKINKLGFTKASKESEMNYNWSDRLTHTRYIQDVWMQGTGKFVANEQVFCSIADDNNGDSLPYCAEI
jgi:hypothetical protein